MGLDLVLLTIYFICIGYLAYQMVLAVEADVEVSVACLPDSETLQQALVDQLIRQGLPDDLGQVLAQLPPPLAPMMGLTLVPPTPRGQPAAESEGLIAVQVLPQGPQPLKPLMGLTVQVLNQTQGFQVAVDWDRSSFTHMNNQARRVIRHTPGTRLDLGLPQVVSVVNPNQRLSVMATSEDCFSLNPDTQLLQLALPLVDPARLLSAPPPARVYALDLALTITPVIGRGMRPLVLLLPFRFRVERLVTQPPIPYRKWFSKR
ncbi:MAG: hypothetical protein VKI82_00215 [Leptolyngbya sp.]|nr:hypothetical protein [Leptolyngbya sp.]